jgi:hypothetical protein
MAIEDVGELVGLEARPVVRHREANPGGLAAGLNDDPASLRDELDGVSHEVVEDLLDPGAVTESRARAIVEVRVFRPLLGTDLAEEAPPRAEDLVPVFRRLYEACMERGLPIGCAPNVHVSLVLLPEECRFFSPRRYRWRTLKLKTMAAAFRYQFDRRSTAAP